MRNIRMLVVAGVTVAGGAVLAAGNAAYPERWAFWHGHIETPKECSGFSNVVDQAVRDGCTAMLIGDGVDYYSCWGNHHRQTLAAALAYCRAKGLQIVTGVWSIGYVMFDTVRRVCRDAIVAPNDGDRKVYIFADCDNMDIRAQNPLLNLT